MADWNVKKGEGVPWGQRGGALHRWEFLGFAGVGDISEPRGDITPLYAPSRKERNVWEVVDEVQGEAGLITTSMEMPRTLATWLLGLRCPVNILIAYSQCARPDVLDVWELADYLEQARVTNITIGAPSVRTPDGQEVQLVSADLSARSRVEVCWPVYVQQADAVTAEDLNEVHFCDNPSCGGACGEETVGCQVGYVVGDTCTILNTVNGGGTWADLTGPAAWEGASDDITSVYCDGDFVILGCGTKGEIAVSTDAGATWSVVDLSAQLGALNYVNDIFGLDKYNLWLAADGGTVLYSADAGLTWEDVSPATTEDLNAIFFYDEDYGIVVGENGAVATTTNGGSAWTARVIAGLAATGVNACVQTTDRVMLVGADGGLLYYSLDGGAAWALKNTSFTDAITDIGYADDLPNFGFLTTDAGELYRTFDGGYSWKEEEIPTATGLEAVHVCTQNTLTIVGASGYVARGTCGVEAVSD